MKKLIIYFTLLPLAMYSQDAITKAIIKSDLALVKKEISNRTTAGQYFTFEDQLHYLNFCQEVLNRRRTAIQFPHYYNGRPVYTPAFPTDKIAPPLTKEAAFFIISLIGSIISLPVGISMAEETEKPVNGLIVLAAICNELLCISILFKCIIKREEEISNFQEQLYQNAIEIKNLFLSLDLHHQSISLLDKPIN